MQGQPQMAPRRMAEGGNVGAMPVGSGQPIPMLMQKYGSEKVMEFLNEEKRLKDIESNVAPELRKDFEMMKANIESRFDPEMVQAIRRARTGPDEVELAEGGVARFENGGAVDIENLLNALMITESGGDPQAVGEAGELGAYQIMPSTAANPGFGVAPFTGDLTDPVDSRNFARDYLQAMLDRYDGDVEAALIAYNAGAGNADKFIAAGRDYDVLPQTGITKPYVSKIMGMSERRVPTPNPGRIGSARAARSMRGVAQDARDFLGSIFEDTRPESVRRDEVDFNRKVRAANQALREGKTRAERAAAIQEVKDAIAREKETEVEQGFDFTPEEVEQGGLGYLQSIGRMQKEAADNAADYLRMMQNQEDMISRANPATTMRGIDTDRVFDTERSIKSPAQRMEEAFPGARDAAARYALDKAAGLTAIQQTPPPETRTRSNNPLVNLGADLGELGGYLRRVLGFQEGGEIKNFQEGDIVEADGEQAIPLSSVTDDPNIFQKGLQLIADNPVEAASIGLIFIPGIGPALGLGARGLAGLRAAAPAAARAGEAARAFLTRKSVQMPASTRLGKLGQALFTRERRSGPFSDVMGSVGGKRPGPFKKKKMTPEEAKKLGIPLKREMSYRKPIAMSGAAGLGLASLMGEDAEGDKEATAQEKLGSAVFQRKDAPATTFKTGDTSTQRRVRDEGTDRSGILRNLGSALTSDNARALYSAFADLGLAGGASRGFEGAQLAQNLAARDFQQQELDAMQRAMDIDEAQLQTTRDIAEVEFLNELISSGTFLNLQNQIADELGLEPESQEVISETVRRITTAMSGSGIGSTFTDADSIVGI
tara:strand:- start:2248 stop:4731 length:2484 start_codon:yes stop_codon:yes gene_type:complete